MVCESCCLYDVQGVIIRLPIRCDPKRSQTFRRRSIHWKCVVSPQPARVCTLQTKGLQLFTELSYRYIIQFLSVQISFLPRVLTNCNDFITIFHYLPSAQLRKLLISACRLEREKWPSLVRFTCSATSTLTKRRTERFSSVFLRCFIHHCPSQLIFGILLNSVVFFAIMVFRITDNLKLNIEKVCMWFFFSLSRSFFGKNPGFLEQDYTIRFSQSYRTIKNNYSVLDE